ncbi:hypothetical protein AcW1_007738 [Taiwanofungus camphoratus]|nr:hypothetical protein AcW1_007738 [Antrodia cinnamomea]
MFYHTCTHEGCACEKWSTDNSQKANCSLSLLHFSVRSFVEALLECFCIASLGHLRGKSGRCSLMFVTELDQVQRSPNVSLVGCSDIHDFVLPVVPHLTHSTPYSPIILTFTLVSFILLIPIVNILPLRMTFLVFGLSPLFLTHPFTRLTLYPVVLTRVRPLIKSFRVQLTRAVDNDRLEDKHWQTEMREVELYENERWSPSASTSSSSEDIASLDAGWGKAYLKPGERKAWTRGRDGWSGVSDDGSGDVSNLTFSLSSGWFFVETEDWRPDLESTWIAPVGADDGGWVYTSDSWLDPHPVPLEEWRTGGMTRRRRWIRRIYFNPISSV